MARLVACLVALSMAPRSAAAGFGDFKKFDPVKEIQQVKQAQDPLKAAQEAAQEALQHSGAAEVVEDLKRHQAEYKEQAAAQLGEAGATASAIMEQLPTQGQVQEKLQGAISNATGAQNSSLQDTTFGDMVQQGKQMFDQTLEENKARGEKALDSIKDLKDLTPEDAMKFKDLTPEDAIKSVQGAVGQNASISAGQAPPTLAHGVEMINDQVPDRQDEEQPTQPDTEGGTSAGLWVVVALLSLVLGGWMTFHHLTKPRRVGQPMLMDSEMGEGSVTAGFMGGSSGARQMTPQQVQPGFTRF